jgi:hypothetical protein
MNTPITNEEAVVHLEKALKAGDLEEIAKWDFIIRSNNDFRIRAKQKRREMDNIALEAKFHESYKL